MQDLKIWKTMAVAVVFVSAATRAEAANDRLAVVVVVAGDPELSDNLTEVAISKLAQRGDHHLVGLREIRASLADVFQETGIGACVQQPSCLSRLGTAARAESALIGEVRREPSQFIVRLVLVDTRTAVRTAESTATVPAEMRELIAAIRRGVAALLEPKQATQQRLPPTLDLRADPAPAPTTMVPAREQKPLPRTRWLRGAGYGAGGAAVIALSAAVVTGSLATATPMGANRVEAGADLARREDYATAANTLFIVGGALAISAIVAFVWLWRHD